MRDWLLKNALKLLWLALGLIGVEVLLVNTRFRSIP